MPGCSLRFLRRARCRAVVLAVVTVSVLAASITAVQADTASELDAARQKVAEAQADANATAAEFSQAQGRYEAITAEIDDLQRALEATKQQAAALRAYVRERAVAAYTGQGNNQDIDFLVTADDPLDVARVSKLLDDANEKDNASTKKLAALRDEIAAKQERLDAQREEQAQVKDRLEAKSAAVQEQLAAANAARDQLAAKLEKEQADAAAAAELARLRAAQEASRAVAAASANSGTPDAPPISPGQVITNPGGGAFQCPLSGSAYSNSYGPRGDGFHYGIDMLAPTGVPEVAVKAGTVSYVPMGGAGGNEAYLTADDGNVYYYAHMSQFVGGPRTVSQGEVIGLVGSTGSSTAPHLHFEIRVGGANGQRINPFPSLQAAGC